MDTSPLRVVDDRLMLTVWVVPAAKRTEISGMHGDALKLRVAAPAREGSANAALVGFLRRRLGCDVSVYSGSASRKKQIRIESGDLAGIALILGIAPG